jgi:hypothetical protein
MTDIEITLTPGKQHLKTNTMATHMEIVEINVDAKFATNARICIAEAFGDATANGLDGMFFVPFPSKASGMDPTTFKKLLQEHFMKSQDTCTFTITSIKHLDEVLVAVDGSLSTLREMILLHQVDGVNPISGIELTKFTDNEGHLLLIMSKDYYDEATAHIDCMCDWIEANNLNSALVMDGMKIICKLCPLRTFSCNTHLNLPHSTRISTPHTPSMLQECLDELMQPDDCIL